jgi:hypothetical protein
MIDLPRVGSVQKKGFWMPSLYDRDYPHLLILTMGGKAPEAAPMIGTFPTDRDCLPELLANPWLEFHAGRGNPLIFQFEARKDLVAFKRRLPAFIECGYRVVQEVSHVG